MKQSCENGREKGREQEGGGIRHQKKGERGKKSRSAGRTEKRRSKGKGKKGFEKEKKKKKARGGIGKGKSRQAKMRKGAGLGGKRRRVRGCYGEREPTRIKGGGGASHCGGKGGGTT